MFKRLMIVMVLVSIAVVPALAQDGEIWCDEAPDAPPGVEIVLAEVQRGSPFKITVIGLDDFDPVIGVFGDYAGGFCNDNSEDAAKMSVTLPTTGEVVMSDRAAQVEFYQAGYGWATVSLRVSSVDGQSGEFVVLMEGFSISRRDYCCDHLAVQITPEMVESDVPLTAYVIGADEYFDPVMILADDDYSIVEDAMQRPIICYDAVTDCYGTSYPLDDVLITLDPDQPALDVQGDAQDAMLTFDLASFADVDLRSEPRYLRLFFASEQRNSYGDYWILLHGAVES